MQVIQTQLCFSNIINVHIRHFLEQRFQAITDREVLDPDIHGYALVDRWRLDTVRLRAGFSSFRQIIYCFTSGFLGCWLSRCFCFFSG